MLDNYYNSNNRHLQRRSDRGQVLGSSNSSANGKRILCPDCKERLYILPQDQNNYMCLECGQKFPVNEVYEQIQQQQQQRKQQHPSSAKLGTIDGYNTNNNNEIGIVQPQNYSGRRKPRSLLREKPQIQQDLEARGFVVLDAQEVVPPEVRE